MPSPWYTVAVNGMVIEQAEVADWCDAETARMPPNSVLRLRPVLAGLRHVLAGRSFGPDGQSGAARRFLGWQAGEPHWMLAPVLLK